MSRVTLMTPAELKVLHYDGTVNLPKLAEELSTAPTLVGEWGAPVALSPHWYTLAGQGDATAIKEIQKYYTVDAANACVEFTDVTYNPEVGVTATVTAKGPLFERFNKGLKEDSITFYPRYWFDRDNRLRIKTWDVGYK